MIATGPTVALAALGTTAALSVADDEPPLELALPGSMMSAP